MSSLTKRKTGGRWHIGRKIVFNERCGGWDIVFGRKYQRGAFGASLLQVLVRSLWWGKRLVKFGGFEMKKCEGGEFGDGGRKLGFLGIVLFQYRCVCVLGLICGLETRQSLANWWRVLLCRILSRFDLLTVWKMNMCLVGVMKKWKGVSVIYLTVRLPSAF